ncbi:uncharacterized protein L969DRAFT_76781 [Mixia osmundae IAM 14324]|uniref:Uncharacterized protein n=1 Tax=Mixia osmundae (strain CBS 9802 / IAM 14324 / JCM 22182 / KY 12970) TaxID=764103 RepID=G7E7X7_MIXOS|nr:uncharacterized protein L969DRAFT_76781 [Mixia osmundae IAM 14324]KEI38538.1 hypothetical protein L969DRAFT_76781 [Mixia osmundae IAM 14324]GAA98937.1 hypothetical protein E5Q_05625 [Mixia osmundae IAM 14324]
MIILLALLNVHFALAVLGHGDAMQQYNLVWQGTAICTIPASMSTTQPLGERQGIETDISYATIIIDPIRLDEGYECRITVPWGKPGLTCTLKTVEVVKDAVEYTFVLANPIRPLPIVMEQYERCCRAKFYHTVIVTYPTRLIKAVNCEAFVNCNDKINPVCHMDYPLPMSDRCVVISPEDARCLLGEVPSHPSSAGQAMLSTKEPHITLQ